jgi:hypothetical protein
MCIILGTVARKLTNESAREVCSAHPVSVIDQPLFSGTKLN